MDEEEERCGKCLPEGSTNKKRMITSLLPFTSLPTQLRVPACGSLFNCHCENKVQDPTNNLECSRLIFNLILLGLGFTILSKYEQILYLIRCGQFYHGACYNIDQECMLGRKVGNGRLNYSTVSCVKCFL